MTESLEVVAVDAVEEAELKTMSELAIDLRCRRLGSTFTSCLTKRSAAPEDTELVL